MKNLRKKTTATLLIAIFMISTIAVAIPVFAIPTVYDSHLIVAGTPGTTDTIVIDMPPGFTLGDLQSISWDYWLVEGYAPHVDIMLDIVVDGTADEALVVEYAYNDDDKHAPVGQPTYGCLTDDWYTTFSDDADGPAAVTDTAMAWATTGAPGPLGGTFGQYNFWYQSLADWKTGSTINTGGGDKTINADTLVLALEIEIDNWIVDTEVYVRNMLVNGVDAAELGLEATVIPAVISISVLPTAVNFGPIIDGGDSAVKWIKVSNTGNVAAVVTADTVSKFYQDYLEIESVAYGPWDLGTISATSFKNYDLQLVAVQGIGTHSGVLVFEATAPPP